MPTRPFLAAWPTAAAASVHLIAIALAGFAVDVARLDRGEKTTAAALVAPLHVTRLVFLPAVQPGGGGGGGGGNRQPGPVRRAESPGTDAVTLRVAKPPEASSRPADSEPDEGALVIDARPMASGLLEQIGLPEGGVSFGMSTGPGTGGGVGDGTGSGIGSGRGPGFGAGSGGGTGGGVHRPGGGVTPPALLKEVRPVYTIRALSERIQGSVILELVVTTDGEPSDIRVVQALDPDLDLEAAKAVRQWRFVPGRLNGRPVNVLVTVVLDFTMR